MFKTSLNGTHAISRNGIAILRVARLAAGDDGSTAAEGTNKK